MSFITAAIGGAEGLGSSLIGTLGGLGSAASGLIGSGLTGAAGGPLGSAATGAATGAAASGAASAIPAATGAAATGLVSPAASGVVGAGSAGNIAQGIAANTGALGKSMPVIGNIAQPSFGSQFMDGASQYFSPLINSYQKTISDFTNPNVGIMGKGFDVVNTANAFRNAIHGNGGEITNYNSQQQPPIPPNKDAVLKAYLATHPEQTTNN